MVTVGGLLISFLLLLFGFIYVRSTYPNEVQRSISLLSVIMFYFQRADLFQHLALQWPGEYIDATQTTASLSSFNIFDWGVEPNCVFARAANGTYFDFAYDVELAFRSASLPAIMILWFVFTQVPQYIFYVVTFGQSSYCDQFGDKAVDGLSTIVSLFFMPYFKTWGLVRVLYLPTV